MVRPTDLEMITIEKILVTISKRSGNTTPGHVGLLTKAPGWVRRQKEQGRNVCKSLSCGFCKKK